MPSAFSFGASQLELNGSIVGCPKNHTLPSLSTMISSMQRTPLSTVHFFWSLHFFFLQVVGQKDSAEVIGYNPFSHWFLVGNKLKYGKVIIGGFYSVIPSFPSQNQ